MTIGQLQTSFSRFKTASAVERSLLPVFFIPIPLFVILLNAGIFASLYLSGSPIEFDGVLRVPGDPLYETEFWSLVRFFALFAGLFVAVGIILLARNEKRRHWLSIDADGRYATYVVTRRRETLTLPGSTHELDRRTGRVASTTRSGIAPTPFDAVFFWAFREQPDESWKVIEKPGRIVLKRIVGPTGIPSLSRRILTWSIRLDESGRPLRATYSVGRGSATSYSMNDIRRFAYRDVGAPVRMPIRPEVRAAIEDPTIASTL